MSRNPCNFQKACWVLHLVYVERKTQTQASISAELNLGTVCHIVHGRRFPNAYPIPMPRF